MTSVIVKLKQAFVQAVLIVMAGLVLAFSVNAIRSDGLGLMKGPVHGTDSTSAMKIYSAQECLQLLQSGKAVFLDAREPALYSMGRLPGALSVPGETVEQNLTRLKELEKSGRLLIAYCDGQGCRKAEELVKVLREKGIRALGLFADGWQVWMDKGYPIDQGSGQ